MTVRAHLLALLADVEEKKKRNGLTSGLIVQHREITALLSSLSEEDGEKEYTADYEKKETEKKKLKRLFYGF